MCSPVERGLDSYKRIEKYREELIQFSQRIADSSIAKKQSKFFKALSDEKRIRILKLLSAKEMCVCELMIALNMSQPNLSHHMRLLENAGIIDCTKKGKWVYCSLSKKENIKNMIKINLL